MSEIIYKSFDRRELAEMIYGKKSKHTILSNKPTKDIDPDVKKFELVFKPEGSNTVYRLFYTPVGDHQPYEDEVECTQVCHIPDYSSDISVLIKNNINKEIGAVK